MIIEDGAFIGSRAVIVEGVRIGAGAVIAPNVVLSASIPIIDVTGPEPVEYRGEVPAAQGRAPRRAAEGVRGRHVRPAVRADRRRAERVDRSEDVAQRRAARVRDRRLSSSGTRLRSAASVVAPGDALGRPGERRPARPRAARCRSPPGRCTVTGLSHQPRSTATAAAATDDEPGGARLPRPALPDEHGEVVAAVDANELDVRALGEAGVRSRAAGRGGAGRRASGRRAGRPRAGCRPTPSSARSRPRTRARRRVHLPHVGVRVERVEHPRGDAHARPSRS